MEDLIKALQIFLPYYIGGEYPTFCDHDVMYVCGIDTAKMKASTVSELYKLGFLPGSSEDHEVKKNILGEDFFDWDYENITDEQWDKIKNKISDSFHSYRFGSC